MGIKLGDFIKDPYNVFTEEEATMIYKQAGYVEIEEQNSDDTSEEEKEE